MRFAALARRLLENMEKWRHANPNPNKESKRHETHLSG
jgi:hypothetical protein